MSPERGAYNGSKLYLRIVRVVGFHGSGLRVLGRGSGLRLVERGQQPLLAECGMGLRGLGLGLRFFRLRILFPGWGGGSLDTANTVDNFSGLWCLTVSRFGLAL